MKIKKLKVTALALASTVAILGGSVSAAQCSYDDYISGDAPDYASEIKWNQKVNVSPSGEDMDVFYFKCTQEGLYTIKVSGLEPSDDGAFVRIFENDVYPTELNELKMTSNSSVTCLMDAGNTYYIVAWTNNMGSSNYSITINGFSKYGWEHDYFYDHDLEYTGDGWSYYDPSRFDGWAYYSWCLIGGKWYYFDSYWMATGWAEVDGTWYYFNSDGSMQTGWKKISNTWYYLNNNGSMANGWQKIGGTWYYFKGGAMVTGWQLLGGKYYFFSGSGAMQTGWIKSSGDWYYLNSDGSMAIGWKKLGNTWYYFYGSGCMAQNWLKLGGTWYFMGTDGAMVTGSKNIGGKTYNFNSNGVCLNP